jgi:methyltransferase-like protein/2-polyprenyl-3-methyl-5-hydroxy-6-metoxy-1,4-benzoquinol methylase
VALKVVVIGPESMSAESHPRYDQVPYQSKPFARTHPRWLATVAAVFGMRAPRPDTARILELGCAGGGNLIPMAESLPQSSSLGIDLSNAQIEEGQRFIARSGLRNVTLRQGSIADLGERDGQFDYIICHGVYSWVPRDVQRRILEVSSELLSPNGIAYISYNALPGWGMLGVLRDMMRFHAGRFSEPAKQIQQSRALLNVLAKTVPAQDNPYGMLLKQVSEKLHKAADWYIYHEHLEEDNDPAYFHEFVARAGAAGLQFLGEADLLSMLTNQLPEEVQAALREVSSNIVHSEQYMDFFRNRTFRETLLCRADVTLNRRIDADKIRPLAFASDLEPQGSGHALKSASELVFAGAHRPNLGVSDPLFKTALVVLREAWPRFLPVIELEAKARSRLEMAPPTAETTAAFVDRLWGWFTRQLVSMSAAPAHCASVAGERPLGSVVARTQLELGHTQVTDLLHRVAKIGAFDAMVLSLLDGSRDRPALAARLVSSRVAREGSGKDEPLDRRIEAALQRLAAGALLRA